MNSKSTQRIAMKIIIRHFCLTYIFQTKPKRPNRPPPPSRPTKPSPKAAQKNIEDEDDDFQPVNIDLTVVKNTLESYKAQQGLPGPASNILAGFGIKLPQDQVNGKT